MDRYSATQLLRTMAGFGDGYVGTATDALKIRRYQKKREDALKDMELRKKKAEESSLNAGLKRFDAGESTSLCEYGV